MPFRFKLDKVLRYRTRRMEAEARKLHEIESAALVLERENARMTDRCRELTRAAASGITDTGLIDRRRLTDFVRGQQRLIRDNAERIRDIRRRADAQRQVLLGAQREVKALELLKDRRAEEWLLRQRRLDQKRTDEIASRGSGRGT